MTNFADWPLWLQLLVVYHTRCSLEFLLGFGGHCAGEAFIGLWVRLCTCACSI